MKIIKYLLEFRENRNIKKPKFRIWDYVVEPREYSNTRVDEFICINSIRFKYWNFLYNTHYTYEGTSSLVEKELRLPTKEELKIYFK